MIFRITFLFIASFLFLSSSSIQAQFIKGVILDSETKEPAPFANIYFNASQHGTVADENGRFELVTEGYVGHDIIVSCVGYESWIIENFQDSTFYKIFIIPSSKVLREVVIVPNDLPRWKKEKMFIREFLGLSSNAKSCTIENLDDLYLVYFKETKTLEGYCDKPLIIHNKALGYKINYFLDVFKADDKTMYYRGNSLFEEDENLRGKELASVHKKRENTYYGSRIHFFRELWNGPSKKQDFVVETEGLVMQLDSLVTEEFNDVKYLLPRDYLKITYQYKTSYLEFKERSEVLFTKYGYFDPKPIFWEGDMGDQRVGDLLPYEYWP